MDIVLETLEPGQSDTLTATWYGSTFDGSSLDLMAGSFVVTNQLAPAAAGSKGRVGIWEGFLAQAGVVKSCPGDVAVRKTFFLTSAPPCSDHHHLLIAHTLGCFEPVNPERRGNVWRESDYIRPACRRG